MPAHDHDHDHDHTPIQAGDQPPGYYEIMETAIRELLVEKGLIKAGEIRRQVEVLDSRNPALGAKVVARAWVDPGFRARLLANGRAGCEELGISFYDDTGGAIRDAGGRDSSHFGVELKFSWQEFAQFEGDDRNRRSACWRLSANNAVMMPRPLVCSNMEVCS